MKNKRYGVKYILLFIIETNKMQAAKTIKPTKHSETSKASNDLTLTNVQEQSNKKNCYLIYYIKVEPLDNTVTEEIIASVRTSIDLDKVVLKPETYIGQRARQYLRANDLYYPRPENMGIKEFYSEYIEKNCLVKILFFKLDDYRILREQKMDMILCALIHRTIWFENHLLADDYKFYNYELKCLINKILNLKHTKMSNIYINDNEGQFYNPDILKYNMNYLLKKNLDNKSITNINEMLDIESGIDLPFIVDKLLILPNGDVYNYSVSRYIKANDFINNLKFYNIKGGLVIENYKSNKIFELLCLAMNDTNKRTLILLPHQNNKKIWQLSFSQYFKIELPEFITIASVDEFDSFKSNSYDRLIIDSMEKFIFDNKSIHLLQQTYPGMNDKIIQWCIDLKCEHKWCLISSIEHINIETLVFLTNMQIEDHVYYSNAVKYKVNNKFFEKIILA